MIRQTGFLPRKDDNLIVSFSLITPKLLPVSSTLKVSSGSSKSGGNSPSLINGFCVLTCPLEDDDKIMNKTETHSTIVSQGLFRAVFSPDRRMVTDYNKVVELSSYSINCKLPCPVLRCRTHNTTEVEKTVFITLFFWYDRRSY